MKKVILCMLMVFTTSVTIMAQKQAIYDRSSIKCMGGGTGWLPDFESTGLWS